MSYAADPDQSALWPEPEDEGPSYGRQFKERCLERGWPLRLTFKGRAVPEKRADDACQLLRIFCSLSGQSFRCFNSDGSASESLKRIIGAMTTHGDVPFEQWAATIEAVLHNPWWGDGPASIGVVFGPKVVDQNLENPDHGRKTVKNGKALAVLRSVATA